MKPFISFNLLLNKDIKILVNSINNSVYNDSNRIKVNGDKEHTTNSGDVFSLKQDITKHIFGNKIQWSNKYFGDGNLCGNSNSHSEKNKNLSFQ